VERWESPVEKAIREAQERGEFDNLPGAGRPLRSLGNPEVEDPDWWVKSLVERENLDLSGAMSPSMVLRKEAAGFPESLLDLRTEVSVRAVLDDYNQRVREDRLRPAVGPRSPVWARIVDVDEMVDRWRDLREERRQDAIRAATEAAAVTATDASHAARRARGGWIRRLLGRW
jgi:hypothetical protein